MGAWAAMRRGPIVRDRHGHERRLVWPGLFEFVFWLVICTITMLVLYSGLDTRNAKLLAEGGFILVPRTALDDALSFWPWLVVPYYSYFALLLFFSVLTIRDRRLTYEGVVGYLTIAAIAFITFFFVPSRMLQPDISSCPSTLCRMLAAMYRLDDGFNILPSLHVAYSTLVWLFFRRYMPELRWYVGMLVFLIALATVLLKRHYFVDIPAGIVLATVVFHAARVLGPRLADATRPMGPRNTMRHASDEP